MRRLLGNMDYTATMGTYGGVLVGFQFEQFHNRYLQGVRNLLCLLNRGIEILRASIVDVRRGYSHLLCEVYCGQSLSGKYLFQFHIAKLQEKSEKSSDRLDLPTKVVIFANDNCKNEEIVNRYDEF